MSEPAGEPQKVDILLVDDRPGNLLSLKGVLDRPDYNLVLASSGVEALRLVLRHDFALILLDVAMPGMDGFEVAKLLKEREKYRTVPIIFVTASVQHIEWIFRGYSVGAVDFLQKPLDPHAVRAKVSVFVEQFRQKKEIERQAARIADSERRERVQELRRVRDENDRRYRNLAEAIPQIVWNALPDGQFESLNRHWAETTGMPIEDSLGMSWRAALHPADVETFEARFESALASRQPFTVESRLRQRDGSYRWYLCRGVPDRSEEGADAWVGTFTDIDEQRRASDEANAAVQLRDEFLSVASHKLRTPLTSLQLQLESIRRILQRSEDDALATRINDRLSNAVRQTHRLSGLVNSLLDVSRIATGRLELATQEADLADAVSEAVDRFREDAQRAGSELRLVQRESVPSRFDPLRLEQVLNNLLSNAIKYAPGKPIEVGVGPDPQVPDGALFWVRDEGIGIAPEQVDRIFERFERAAPTRHYGGLGLGLFIVSQIVEAHGGRVDVESDLGKGATFRVHLPRHPDRLRDERHECGDGQPPPAHH